MSNDNQSKGRTVPTKDLLKVIKQANEENPEDNTYPEWAVRPTKRSECKGGPRPCPFVSCEQHLYLDVNAESGAIKFNFPDTAVEDMKESCTLDVADRAGVTLEEVGEIMNLTRERIRQIEMRAIVKIKESTPALLGCIDCGKMLTVETANTTVDGYVCSQCLGWN